MSDLVSAPSDRRRGGDCLLIVTGVLLILAGVAAMFIEKEGVALCGIGSVLLLVGLNRLEWVRFPGIDAGIRSRPYDAEATIADRRESDLALPHHVDLPVATSARDRPLQPPCTDNTKV